MAAQDEIAFPTTIETTSTPEPKERYVDNEPVAVCMVKPHYTTFSITLFML